MKRQNFFTIFFAMFSLFLFGCQQDHSEEKAPQKKSERLSLSVQVNTSDSGQSSMVPALYSTQNANFTLIDQITIEVKLDGTTIINPKEMVKNGSLWTVTLENLLPNKNYSFLGRAYEKGVETFNGSSTQSFANSTGNQVTITLNPTEEVYLAIPRITQIIRPAKQLADTTGDIRVTVAGSSNETLTYEFKKESTSDLGTFIPDSGQVALAGSTGTMINQYKAPATIGNYNFSVKVSNAKNNSVEGVFQIEVNDISSDLSLQVNPVVHGIHVKCAGSQLIWTATAVGYNGADSQLSWQWQFDGSSDAFQNPTENGAILSNYNQTLSGPVKLTVTDGNTNGGTTIVTWQLEENFCPLVSDSNQLKLAAFDEFQSINTKNGLNIHHFQIGTDNFLVSANHLNDVSNYNIPSIIYKWNGTGFEEFQTINTNGAFEWDSFQIDSVYYLVVANNYDGTNATLPSKIYKWNGTSFEEFQSIDATRPVSVKFFQIGTDNYLAIADHQGPAGESQAASKIYKWNGTTFEEFQSIVTNKAHDLEFFQVGSTPFIVVANHHDGTSYNTASVIYKWNGAAFEELQSIATNAAHDWASFRLGSDTYIAVANHYNGTSRDIPSKTYRWNGSNFEEFQSINTHGASYWKFFQVGVDSYLTLANKHAASYNIDSVIYKWNGSSFEEFQKIGTSGAVDWEFFQIGEQPYLAVSNRHDGSSGEIQSKIYKARFE